MSEHTHYEGLGYTSVDQVISAHVNKEDMLKSLGPNEELKDYGLAIEVEKIAKAIDEDTVDEYEETGEEK